MDRDATPLVCIALMTLIAGGCAQTQTQVGFSNAPALNRPRIETAGENHDVIANGRDSCSRQGAKHADPMPYRLIPCDEEPEGHRVDPAKNRQRASKAQVDGAAPTSLTTRTPADRR